jgi:hypothetical protein
MRRFTLLFMVGGMVLAGVPKAVALTEEVPKPPTELIDEAPPEVPEEIPVAVEEQILRTRENRSQKTWTVLAALSVFDTWIPYKWGGSLVYTPDAAGSWELEYLRSKLSYGAFIDLGSITDERLEILFRSYGSRNSFNFHYGLSYTSLKLVLGDEFLSSISGSPASLDLVKVKTLGLVWGIGNRWQSSKGYTWSLDWLSLSVPIMSLESKKPYTEASNDADKTDDVNDAVSLVKKIPEFTALKVQLGYSF